MTSARFRDPRVVATRPFACGKSLLIAWVFLLLGGAAVASDAPDSLTYETVHDFHYNVVPKLTVGQDGNLYGSARGEVFRIDQAGTYSTYFTSVEGIVARLVVGPDGFLYGFTGQTPYSFADPEPEADHGVFFRLDYQANYTLLATLPHSIATDLLVGSDGAFYGGSAYEYYGDSIINPTGMVKLTTTGVFTALGGNQGSLSPVPQVVGSDGAIYGTRSLQWGIAAQSSVFRLDTAGNFTTIHQMNEEEGFLENFILGSDGFLYATSQYGGEHSRGNVLRLDNTGAVTFLHHFAPSEGLYPVGSLTVGGDGAIYGVAEFGGTGGGLGAGTVYRVDTAGTFTVQHTFNWPAGGGHPQHGLLLAKDGALYGVASSGSTGATAFRIDSSGTATYPVIPSQFMVSSSLIQGSDCGLYGTAFYYDQATGYSDILFRLFEPGHLCQTIEFAPLDDRTLGDPPFTVSATASSGLPVSFSASGRCSLSGDQVRLKTGVGVCSVTASQAGDSRFEAAAEVTQEFLVRPPRRMQSLR